MFPDPRCLLVAMPTTAQYWEMKALESATVGRRLLEVGMGEWILAVRCIALSSVGSSLCLNARLAEDADPPRMVRRPPKSLVPFRTCEYLQDPTATNMDECIEYVARAETEAGGEGVFAHQSEHALFQILTPKAAIRLSHGR